MFPNEAEAQLETLYRKYARLVFQYAVRRGCPKADAEDVVIDTFVSCWRSLPKPPEQPLAWLFGAARGILANRRRARGREHALCERIAQAEETAEMAERGESPPTAKGMGLFIAISRLSERDREALLLVEWDGLSMAEAAMVLDTSSQAVRQRLSRTRRLLQQELAMLDG